MRPLLLLLALLCLSLPAAARLADPVEPQVAAKAPRDLAQIRDSGELRVLVNQSRNTYASVRGQPTGSENLRLEAFLQFLNQPRGGTTRPVTLKVIPLPKEQLLAAMQRGEGDLLVPGETLDVSAVGDLLATQPIIPQVPMVVVTRQGQRRYQHVEELAGRMLVLPAGSAALPAILRLNQQLREQRQPPLMIEWADSSLASEDVLEMVAAGIYRLAVVDLPLAERWARVLPGLRIDRQLVLDTSSDWVWMVRREAPILLASANFFLRNYSPPASADAAFQRAYRGQYKVRNPLSAADQRRLEKLRPVLQRHAGAQQFDWLLLAALAYKESSLNPAARGKGGPLGLMQITPAAARSVGVSNIQQLDNNVQAAARYLARLRRNFANPQIAERERLAFTLAAYNLGPQRVQAMRAEARRRGLNANQWFFQVERVAAEQLGLQPVTYVNSLNKYYQAFAEQRDFLEPR
ncbi:transglycosylase SLT domain-containing protein [Pseudomonas sp. N040]|uniref:transglycosylase SLT domain-containing protein n=1 Tax=Pseudomonas sp. N040 TaxID=2785325 RepID=UPI0018A33986|nr:transglycosylase SLT domain-containing protein [Pseudomonas sp. N040]MBF7729462.1 transglycosylase SLT domain-containing protein [Pseudomonas sp. N040]MBW7013102.1 transglycosylase SLT domain-containing protein [Pseudomonas sp. N040]